jgi:DNA polymerase-3 subunit alpha
MLPGKSGDLFIDTLLRYGELYRKDSMDSSISLFGDVEELKPERPEIPEMVGDEDIMEKLKFEKELVGMYLSSHPLDTYSFELDNFTTCAISDLPDLVSECFEKKEKMKVNVAGFITAASEGMTKTGRPMSRMTVEDYSGSYEFAFFGKDHEAFMQYEKLHTAIFIEGVIEEKYYIKPEEREKGKTSEFSFKPKNMMLLGNVADTYVKGLSINVTTPMLSPQFREKLVGLLKKNKGNVPLTMFLYDPVKKWNIEFLSHKFKVQVTLPFIDELKELGITYSVIKK